MYKAYLKTDNRLLERDYIFLTLEELNALIDGEAIEKPNNLGELTKFIFADFEMITNYP